MLSVHVLLDDGQFFDGHGWFTGKITAYAAGFYTVEYDIGDWEELDEAKIQELVEKEEVSMLHVVTAETALGMGSDNLVKPNDD